MSDGRYSDSASNFLIFLKKKKSLRRTGCLSFNLSRPKEG